MKIITDHKYRNLIYGYELTEKERAEFDYIEDINDHNFFRYKGWVYDPGEFIRVDHHLPDSFKTWDGYQSDTFFSGILIRYSRDFEQVMVARYAV